MPNQTRTAEPNHEAQSSPETLADHVNQAAEEFARTISFEYPECSIRESILRKLPVGRYVMIAMDLQTRTVRAIFMAEFEHASERLQITATIFPEPVAPEILPDPFRSIALV